MSDKVTVVITSCNRPNELKKTLHSFFKYNTYPIQKIIIIDDSGKKQCIDDSIEEIPTDIERLIIYNDKNIGQIKSIDKAYSHVDTEYIFHCEDDWEFYVHGFIEKSMNILKIDNKIFTVWLREYRNLKVVRNGHLILPDIYHNTYRKVGITRERTNIWNGFTFNPGLRRTKDYKLLAPYSKYIGSKDCNCGGVEQALSRLYYTEGFYSTITHEQGYVKHIGWDNPTIRNY